jgi:hypothetical protein
VFHVAAVPPDPVSHPPTGGGGSGSAAWIGILGTVAFIRRRCRGSVCDSTLPLRHARRTSLCCRKRVYTASCIYRFSQ